VDYGGIDDPGGKEGTTMMKVLAVCGALLLPLAACGGSDDAADDSDAEVAATDGSADATTEADAPPPDDDTDESDESADETTAPASGDDGGDSAGSGPSTATATIGGETYEFSTEGAIVAQCQTDMFGIFSVQLPGVDGDGGISIVALLEGTDPAVVEQVNAVEVSIADDRWIADESSDLFDMSDALQPGMSQVDSVEIDGSTVRGTATFVSDLSLFNGGEPETVTGTFEATCGEERLS
jgi:hypothetical protein